MDSVTRAVQVDRFMVDCPSSYHKNAQPVLFDHSLRTPQLSSGVPSQSPQGGLRLLCSDQQPLGPMKHHIEGESLLNLPVHPGLQPQSLVRLRSNLAKTWQNHPPHQGTCWCFYLWRIPQLLRFQSLWRGNIISLFTS